MIWGDCDSVAVELIPAGNFSESGRKLGHSGATFDLSGAVIEASVHTS